MLDHFVLAPLWILTVLLMITAIIGKPPIQPATIVLKPIPVKSLFKSVFLL